MTLQMASNRPQLHGTHLAVVVVDTLLSVRWHNHLGRSQLIPQLAWTCIVPYSILYHFVCNVHLLYLISFSNTLISTLNLILAQSMIIGIQCMVINAMRSLTVARVCNLFATILYLVPIHVLLLLFFLQVVPLKAVELYLDLRRTIEDQVRVCKYLFLAIHVVQQLHSVAIMSLCFVVNQGFTEPLSEKLLPDLHPQEQHVFTLVLDLNETLVYSDWKVTCLHLYGYDIFCQMI